MPKPAETATTAPAPSNAKEDSKDLILAERSDPLKNNDYLISNLLTWGELFIYLVQKNDKNIWLQLCDSDQKIIAEIVIDTDKTIDFRSGVMPVVIWKMSHDQVFFQYGHMLGSVKIVAVPQANPFLELHVAIRWHDNEIHLRIDDLQIFNKTHMLVKFAKYNDIIMLTPGQLTAGINKYKIYYIWLNTLNVSDKNEWKALKDENELDDFIAKRNLPLDLIFCIKRVFNTKPKSEVDKLLCFIPSYPNIIRIESDLVGREGGAVVNHFKVVNNQYVILVKEERDRKIIRFFKFIQNKFKLIDISEDSCSHIRICALFNGRFAFACLDQNKKLMLQIRDIANCVATHDLGISNAYLDDLQLLPQSTGKILVGLIAEIDQNPQPRDAPKKRSIIFISVMTGDILCRIDFSFTSLNKRFVLAINSSGKIALCYEIDALTKQQIIRIIDVKGLVRAELSPYLIKVLIDLVEEFFWHSRDKKSAAVLSQRPVWLEGVNARGLAAAAVPTVNALPAIATAGAAAAFAAGGPATADVERKSNGERGLKFG